MTSTPLAGAGDGRSTTVSIEEEALLLDDVIAGHEAQLSRLRAQRRVIPVALVTLLALLSIAAVALGYTTPSSLTLNAIKDWLFSLSSNPIFAILIAVAITLTSAHSISLTLREASLQSEIESLVTKKRVSKQLPREVSGGEVATGSYFDSLVKINVDNLSEYYTLVKLHTNNSFRASLLAGAIGFIFILIGVIAGFGGVETATPAKLAAVSGIVTEFISAIFFYLYNRTVRQLKEYHDSLLAVQNVLLSFKLVNDTEDIEAKRDMTMQMASFLLSNVTMVPRSSGSEESTPRSRRVAKEGLPEQRANGV